MTDDLERTLKVLTATSGAKYEWINLARAAIAGAVKWKRERDELQARINEAYRMLGPNQPPNAEGVRSVLLGGSESGGS